MKYRGPWVPFSLGEPEMADLESLSEWGPEAGHGKLPVLVGLHFRGPKHREPLVVIILASPALTVQS